MEFPFRSGFTLVVLAPPASGCGLPLQSLTHNNIWKITNFCSITNIKIFSDILYNLKQKKVLMQQTIKNYSPEDSIPLL